MFVQFLQSVLEHLGYGNYVLQPLLLCRDIKVEYVTFEDIVFMRDGTVILGNSAYVRRAAIDHPLGNGHAIRKARTATLYIKTRGERSETYCFRYNRFFGRGWYRLVLTQP